MNTVESIITENRQRATDAKLASKMWLSWQLDTLRVQLGQAEVVEWPEQRIERHLRRGQKPAAAMPEGSRLVFHNGGAYLVRDIEGL